jgi:hypothetical protein
MPDSHPIVVTGAGGGVGGVGRMASIVRDGTIRLPFGLGRSPSGFDSFVRNTGALRNAGGSADR